MIHKIQPSQNIVDAVDLGVQPGDTIEIPEGHETPLRFIGVMGAVGNPVTISGGSVTVPITLSYAFKFETSKYFRFTKSKGRGGHIGVAIEKRSTDFEIDNLDLAFIGFAGIMAKDDSAKRGEFTMANVRVHHCKVTDTGGEGLYIGNSGWSKGECHELENVHLYSNRIERSGWDGIQLGACPIGARILHNEVRQAGVKKATGQSNGIQIGEGTGGLTYKNSVMETAGNGIICLGIGDNVIQENDLTYCGESGIFADTRGFPLGTGIKIRKNTIVNPRIDCIRMYAKLPSNQAEGNDLLYPGGAYIYLAKDVKMTDVNNYKVR